MAIPTAYHGDSDADDEYERSVMTSPILATDDEGSPTDTDPPSTEPTPTAFGHSVDITKLTPANSIVGWTTDQVADYISGLGLGQYCEFFLENEISGESLVALRHEELKEMGIVSIGHRLTILKGIFDVKVKQGIPLDPEDYKPPSTEASAMDQTATMADISRIIKSIDIRDHRIQAAEAELRKITEEYRKLRDELLPVFRSHKNHSQPLPYHPQSQSPDNIDNDVTSPLTAGPPQDSKQGSGSSLLQRNWSTKRLLPGGSTPKNNSPTHIPQSIAEMRGMTDTSTLEPTPAAIAASNHLTAGMNGGPQSSSSPNQANIPSPTSPNQYSNHMLRGSHRDPQSSAASARAYTYADDASNNYGLTASQGTDPRNPTPTPGSATARRQPRDTYQSTTQTASSVQSGFDDTAQSSSTGTGGGSSGGVEIFKSFRVSMDDPCEKVLPAALKKYNINQDWKNFALYIVFGDQERCLGLKEKPLILFKQLDREGKKPMFMLRRHAAPLEGHSGPTGSGGGMGDYGGMGGLGGGRGNTSSIQLPGGVL